MFVCLCEAVNDRTVEEAIAHGARTVHAIGEACGAGTNCGGCRPLLEEMLKEATGWHRDGSSGRMA